MNRFQWTLLGLFCVLVATWLVAPTLIVVPMSFNERQSLAFPPMGSPGGGTRISSPMPPGGGAS